jgi:hypothetical protein
MTTFICFKKKMIDLPDPTSCGDPKRSVQEETIKVVQYLYSGGIQAPLAG